LHSSFFRSQFQIKSLEKLVEFLWKKFWPKFLVLYDPVMDEANDQALMTYVESAEFPGISDRTLERYVHDCRIPYIQLPKRGAWAGVRFMRSQLLHWLQQRTVKAWSKACGAHYEEG
jgi:hypothetical protein